jgi:hypothetical protein
LRFLVVFLRHFGLSPHGHIRHAQESGLEKVGWILDDPVIVVTAGCFSPAGENG